jgi:photosystem II stability/assembly factor-like uncharacterized protein
MQTNSIRKPAHGLLVAGSSLVCASILGLPDGALGQLSVSISNISPRSSTVTNSADTGGRVNGVAVASDGTTFYAATEWGGLYKSVDTGRNWFHLENHLPFATWDVAVDPTNPRKVYATSFYDGRVDSLAGINVSNDGGVTWIHPPTAVPPPPPYTSAARREEPSAFGISIDPDDSQDVYIGTNAGLAISHDGGVTWEYVDPNATPTSADRAKNVWDVVVHHGGIIDVVGDRGHQRSLDGGVTWTTATTDPLSKGLSSIAVSPDEPDVLFATSSRLAFQSVDGGNSWPDTLAFAYPESRNHARVPFVATNKRAGRAFDLWYGNIELYRAACTTADSPASGEARCPPNDWGSSQNSGAHADVGEILFQPGLSRDACPVMFSNDGGVHFNTRTTIPFCHSPAWHKPDVAPFAMWPYSIDGGDQPGTAEENLYLMTQDNGSWASADGGALSPLWKNKTGGDGFEVAARSDQVVFFTNGGFFVRNPGMTGGHEVATSPPGDIWGFTFSDTIRSLGPDQYVVTTNSGVYFTTDITADPTEWTQLGKSSTPSRAVDVRVAFSGSTSVCYVRSGSNDETERSLWRYGGTASGGTWQQILPPGGIGGFGVYDVDPNNPNRIIALNGRPSMDPQMILSTNGGGSWTVLTALDNLITGSGQFRYTNRRGPGVHGLTFGGYAQPTLVAFDPVNPRIIVAGAADSGVFVSTDGGMGWSLVTDPLGTDPIKPHIPRPRAAYFDHEPDDTVNIYLASQGRGAVRIRLNPLVLAAVGRVTLLRVHEVGTGYGPPTDFLDAEVIVTLDTAPGKAFGFKLRDDEDEAARRGMLDLLRDALNHSRTIRIEYVQVAGRNNLRILRVVNP